jgi:ubiquinone/menaquinone biosynthesis C-methylase UbiE
VEVDAKRRAIDSLKSFYLNIKSKKNCNLCGTNRDAKIMVEFCIQGIQTPMSILCCKNCGLVYTDENMKPEDIKVLYNKLGDFNTFCNYDQKLQIEEKTKIMSRYIKSTDKGNLLDVGCGQGHFLIYMIEKGFNCYGVDVSRYFVEQGQKEHGINLFVGTLEEANYPNSFFTWVTAFDVLEHLQNPLVTLKEINRVLKKGGNLVFEVPNENTIFRFLAKIIFKISWGRVSWPLERLYYPFHLYYFSPKTINKLLKEAGYVVVQITAKESYFTKYGLNSYSFLKRIILKSLVLLDSIFNTGAKFLVYARKV